MVTAIHQLGHKIYSLNLVVPQTSVNKKQLASQKPSTPQKQAAMPFSSTKNSSWKHGLSTRQRIILGCAFICVHGVTCLCSLDDHSSGVANLGNCPSRAKLTLWNGLERSNIFVERISQAFPDSDQKEEFTFFANDASSSDWIMVGFFGPNSLSQRL